jgi:peptidoglycan hydrolase CwlO-like protein
MDDGHLVQILLGIIGTAALALGAYSLRRAVGSEVLDSQMRDVGKHLADLTTLIQTFGARGDATERRVYEIASELAVLRAQINGVNGNNGLNSTVKLDQVKIERLTRDIEDIKRSIMRLELLFDRNAVQPPEEP